MEALLTLFVGIAAAAILVQAIVLVSIYLLSRRVAGQMELTLGQLRDLMPGLRTVTDNLKTVSQDMVEIGTAAREQFQRIEEMIGETGRALESQLEKVERMSREVTERVNETAGIVQDSILRPVREVGALARGVTRGLEVLLNRRNRSPVDEARQDEELFI